MLKSKRLLWGLVITIIGLFFTSSSTLLEGVQFFDVDQSGNIYTFDGKSLVSYSQKLEKRNEFSDINLGAPKSIDANDPLNIVAFFEASQKVVFFDKNLTPKVNPVSIEDLNILGVSAVCASYNTGFWMFNELDKKLYRYNRYLKETNSSVPLPNLVDKKVFVTKILETNVYLLVNDSVNGIFFFDKFGTYLRTLPIKGSMEISILDSDLRILKADTIFNYSMINSVMDTLPLENNDYKSFKYTNDKFFLLTKSGQLSGISFRSGKK